MSSWKTRPSKLKYRTEVTTLDELHKNFMSDFGSNKMSIPQKRKKIQSLTKKIENLDSTHQDYLSQKSKLKTDIKNLEGEIKHSEGESEYLEYVSRAGDLLINYYNITSGIYYNSDNMAESDNVTDLARDTPSNNLTDTCSETYTNLKKQIKEVDKLKELNDLSKANRKVKKPVKKRRTAPATTVSKNIFQFLDIKVESEKTESIMNDTEIILNRATLQHKFLMLVDKGYACEKVKADKVVYCTNCKIEKLLIQSEGCYVCKECGDSENVIMESELPSHRELANEKQKYPYKKINHLKEKLNQFQSRESADVPDEICHTVMMDLRKNKINPQRCTPLVIRGILKKRKLTDWYEHLQQIYSKISGNPPITLSNEVEETIISMFQAMQESFRRHCPQHRSNFLSYSYVLNKIFKILLMPEHSKYFGLLKSKEKLREQDIIWAKICRDLGWKFHSSF